MAIRDTLLLVNDDAASRDALQTAFEKNYNLLEAENGETEFKFPSDWYLWEKAEVEKEVNEGRYYF